jgi:hypothetical protein
VSECWLVVKVQEKGGDVIENVWNNPEKITLLKGKVIFIMSWK